MRKHAKNLYGIINRTISFKYFGGDKRKPFPPHATGWRNYPFLVVVYVEDGDYYYEIRDEGRFYVQKGQAVLIPAGVIHKVGMDGNGILSFAHIQYYYFENIDLMELLNVPFETDAEHGRIIAEILDELSFIHSKSSFTIKEIATSKMLGFKLLHVLMEISESRKNQEMDFANVERLSPVLSYIRTHLAEDINRKFLADLLSLSETRFHYVFKEAMSMAPMDYIRKLRISKAQVLLITTNLPIKEIAARVGYTDLYNFSKIFKSKVGTSPIKYRQNNKQPEAIV